MAEKYYIDFVCFDNGLKKIKSNIIDVVYVKKHPNKILRVLIFIYMAIKQSKTNDYNILFSYYYKLIWLIGIFGKAQLKIIDIRSGSLDKNLLIRSSKNISRAFSTLFFDKTTVLSESLARKLMLHLKKTYTVPLGAEVLYDGPKSYNKMHLIYIGNLKYRNIHITIEGFSAFYKKYSNKISLKYDIFGFSDNLRDEDLIKATIDQKGMQDIVIFHGRKTHEELKNFLEDATIGVAFIPQYVFYDVQPSTKIFEYALSGLITIATDTFENRSVINSYNGFICQDNAESFYSVLEKTYLNLDGFNDKTIRNTLIHYHWKNITNEILLPILEGYK